MFSGLYLKRWITPRIIYHKRPNGENWGLLWDIPGWDLKYIGASGKTLMGALTTLLRIIEVIMTKLAFSLAFDEPVGKGGRLFGESFRLLQSYIGFKW